MLKEIKNDVKKHMWNKTDPHHLLNSKNVYGQTPLYVACKYGNLNIVKLLLEKGASPDIKSLVDEYNEESNLQVAARWKHFEVSKHLLENCHWGKAELRDAMDTEDL